MFTIPLHVEALFLNNHYIMLGSAYLSLTSSFPSQLWSQELSFLTSRGLHLPLQQIGLMIILDLLNIHLSLFLFPHLEIL